MDHIQYFTYQFDGYPVVRYEVGGEVYAAMGTLAKYVHQFISFAKNSRNLSLNINKFTIHISFIARIRCARSLLCSSRYTMLACTTHTHLMTRVRTLPRLHQVAILIWLLFPWPSFFCFNRFDSHLHPHD